MSVKSPSSPISFASTGIKLKVSSAIELDKTSWRVQIERREVAPSPGCVSNQLRRWQKNSRPNRHSPSPNVCPFPPNF
jgi:hypothetical protein